MAGCLIGTLRESRRKLAYIDSSEATRPKESTYSANIIA